MPDPITNQPPSTHTGFNLTLVHTADTYSALSAVDASSTSCQPVNGSYVTSGGQLACFGGVARMKTVIDQQRARSDTNVFVVDAGNIIATSLYYYVAGPSLVASYYAQLGYDLVHLQVCLCGVCLLPVCGVCGMCGMCAVR